MTLVTRYAVASSDGTLYGPFDASSEVAEWIDTNTEVAEMLGDWNVREIYGFENPDAEDAWKYRELSK